MGKSAPKYPDPPDPWDTASAQGTINQETAYSQQRLNQIDQSTPYGTLTYVPTGEDVTYNRFNQQLYDDWSNNARNAGKPLPPSDAKAFNTTVSLGPRYRAEVQLTPEGQAIQQGQMELEQGMLDVGNDQLGRVANALGQPLDLQGIPQAAQNVPGNVARLPQQYQIGAAGPINQSAPQFSQQRRNTPNTGPLVRNVDASPIGRMGPIDDNRSVIGNTGPIQRSVGADDFGDDRQRVEDALMQRMQPYLDQRREQERTRLVNQGFADPASEGYSNAMDEVYRAENDARLGAILNAGQEQSRLFGMDVAAGQFANTAQDQAFGQAAARADLRNRNIDANLANRMSVRGFNNQAQAQEFGQGIANANLNNAAQQQAYGQAADRADRANANIDANLRNQVVAQQAQNAAQQQRFGQAATRADFYNQQQAQNFAQNVARNQAQFDAAAYQNALRDRAIQERMLLRQTPINEISALTSGTQVALPQFVNTPQSGIQSPDFQGATYASYQGQLANADRQAQQRNAFTQGLFGLGGSALGAFGAINPFGW